MRTKWLLFALPLAILALLLQSSFWVPSYGSQAKNNPQRLVTFIRTEGEAKLFNPILATDGTALDMMQNNLFESLVDSDEHLRLTPKLAESWEISEHAYVAPVPDKRLPNGENVTAQALVTAIERAWKQGELGDVGTSIRNVALAPASSRQWKESVLPQGGKGEPIEVAMTIEAPERVRIELARVEPDLFRKLEPVLGLGYFEGAPLERQIKLAKPEQLPLVKAKLAELLPVGEHNPIIDFRLRKGVRFHDGRPFTSADVKFTADAVLDPKNASPRTSYFDDVKSIDIPDPHTVRVTYRRLYSSAIIGWAAIEILPKHLLDDAALEREMNRRKISGAARKTFSVRTSEFNRNPVGTGPYRFTEWLVDRYVHFTRSDNYWGRKPEFQHVYYRSIPDPLTQEVELGAGALDMYRAQPHQGERYRHDPNFQVVSSKEGYYSYIGYNLRRPPFDDVRVRRALGMAIDVDSIIKYVLHGEGTRATGPYYSNTPFADPSVKPLPYDPEAALRLLQEAGFTKNARGLLERGGKPFEFTMVTNSGNLARKAILTIAQEAWRKLGINCRVQTFEWTVFLKDFIEHRNFDAVVLAWGGGDIDPDKFSIWHSSQTNDYQLNHAGYKSARADELIMKIRETYDREAQIRLTHEFHRLLANDAPYTFLYQPLRPVVFDRRMARITRDADGREVLEKLRASESGDAFFFAREWRKLASAPSFGAQ
jgi:ABC-type transport system substrate-binding protein